MTNAKQEWEAYVSAERQRIAPRLTRIGITLDTEQPQTIGERYLTRPVGSGRKVVFFGRQNDGLRVIVKTSNEARGKDELLHEMRIHAMLLKIHFAYEAFALPDILYFDTSEGILITAYIEQEKPFVDRPLKEQFAIALDAFKAQEYAHPTTAEHWTELERLMEEHTHYLKPGEYRKVGEYAQDAISVVPKSSPAWPQLNALTNSVIKLVWENETILERYDGFLTHWDFTPQNFRIRDGKLYLLDLTSMRFGNKYESWARFINFMELYEPSLARALEEYVQLNRPDEIIVLKVMRAYRLIELIRYYATWLRETEGNTLALAETRIAFWTEVLEHVLDDTPVPQKLVESYKAMRDALRSEDEKVRQRGLH